MQDVRVWAISLGKETFTKWAIIIGFPSLLWQIFFKGVAMPANFLLGLAFILFCIGAFKTWQKEHRKLEALIDPNFQFEILSFVMNNYVESKTFTGSGITLWIHAKNLGGASGIEQNSWQVKAIDGDKLYDGQLEVGLQWRGNTLGFPYRDRAGNVKCCANYFIEEALFSELSKPLEHNQSVIGLLRVDFPDMDFDTLNKDTTLIKIECQDVCSSKPWGCCSAIKEMKCGLIQYPSLKSGDMNYARVP